MEPVHLTQVSFVSIGKPDYRFVVFREAVVSLTHDYIATMVEAVLIALAGAHEDKTFDVIATCCDGGSEQ